jgi:ankyrin repeat protein
MKKKEINETAITEMIRMIEKEKGPAFALAEAARWSNFEELDRLLLNYGDPDRRIPPNDVTPLMLASVPRVASKLVSLGADVNATDIHGNTPLLWFLKLNFPVKKVLPYLKKLVELGAKVDVVSSDGQSAKELAMRKYAIDLESMAK